MNKIAYLLSFILCVIALQTHAKRPYPVRPITNTVVWSAGGGTDSINRMLMAEMAKELDVRINVVNKTGGVAGSIGMNTVLRKRPDGYNLVGISSSNVVAAVNGGWTEKFDVWSPFIVGSSPDVISVPYDSPFKTLEDLVNAAKGTSLKAAAGGMGGIHHIYLLELEKATGVKFKYIPYPGSAPSQTATITKEVDFVITSMAEQAPLLRGKRLRALAMLHPDNYTLDGVAEISSAFIAYPALAKRLPLSQAIGFAVNKKAPKDVLSALTAAFDKAMKSSKVQLWAKQNHYQLSGMSGKPAEHEFSRLESIFTWALDDLGANKISPAKFNIAKPN
ncbi:tripartite tricarboxylate transporter substrate binding protein [Paraglaciecola aquimarina]|uniref:Tripartite tricarboxylate transporter substrate binding protein n=1 Tax=Paraglaciecola aquimarina TaxID=1235557 RepID=A0ABU3SYC4_9ALTE|nr:tripartite tricarboxylate transporter substrate binding protein [Paraglaciecola aquimarina]MDU0355013.1 tripartite tricarboxylate transporter substrate binding protein [Paraglaciecola aquimarina]